MAFQGRYIPVIVRKPGAICDFPGKGSGPPVPILDPPMWFIPR